jgi:hypothetical protein
MMKARTTGKVFQQMVQTVELVVKYMHNSSIGYKSCRLRLINKNVTKGVARIIQSDYFQELREEAELLQFNDENW